MASNGYIELLRLNNRGLKRREGEHITSGGNQWLGVAFMVGDVPLVAPLGDIAEVLVLPDITPVPLAKPWITGIANVRGRLLSVANLSKFLGVTSRIARSQKSKLLVIDQPQIFTGLQVDDVLGIQSFKPRQYEPIALPEDSPLAAYTHGRFRQSEQVWYIFMPSLLTEDPHYLEAAL